ncbi:hypothetical protein RIF23_14515 [Lipingzhangella sp. LS1_29]|uniref:Trypsin-like peptidase n=1 Tax=Lipingzhangella rawalii TaxID=2055835 RepID=A0ABU2H9I0_9ACTN|nr:hypothetical protein [Lipingzhangella rawalii]MDS1271509.1 hypothetical protein [Lipingzhangella rawalii]
MRLDSCRELKLSLHDRETELLAQTEVPWLGLGIAPAGSGEFRLAVRLRDRESVPDWLLDRLSRESHDEFEIVQTGDLATLEARTPAELQKRQRPLVPGCSVGHPDVSAGTLGAFVTVDDTAHILSNSHVIANSGRAELCDPILQPGVADDGSTDIDQVGTLTAQVPLREDQPNVVDAAVARVRGEVEFAAADYPGGPVCSVSAPTGEDTAVEKIGRTTGHTTGRVTAFEVDGLRINFGFAQLVFDGQIEISGTGGSFSSGGDSGSLIWTSTGRSAMGLLFAGSEQGGPDGTGLTYANPLSQVLTAVEARLHGAPAAPRAT